MLIAILIVVILTFLGVIYGFQGTNARINELESKLDDLPKKERRHVTENDV